MPYLGRRRPADRKASVCRRAGVRPSLSPPGARGADDAVLWPGLSRGGRRRSGQSGLVVGRHGVGRVVADMVLLLLCCCRPPLPTTTTTATLATCESGPHGVFCGIA